jgi:hypothetical protein
MPREISGAGGASPTLGALRIPPERVGRQCPPGRGSPPRLVSFARRSGIYPSVPYGD